jgi:hypothetical protein
MREGDQAGGDQKPGDQLQPQRVGEDRRNGAAVAAALGDEPPRGLGEPEIRGLQHQRPHRERQRE